VADFLAGTYLMMRASARAGELDYKKEMPEPTQNEAGLSFLELLPDVLRSLKEDFQRNRERAAAERRARRAATSSPLSERARRCIAIGSRAAPVQVDPAKGMRRAPNIRSQITRACEKTGHRYSSRRLAAGLPHCLR
jgi:hypothetical protein